MHEKQPAMTMRVILLVAILLTSALEAQESAISNKAPINLKAIRGPNTHGVTNTLDFRFARGTLATIQAFKRSQNPDGSWGCNEKKGLSTPLVLTALCGQGKHAIDNEYGECVSRAQNWVLANSPTSVAERVVSAVALSVAAYSQYGDLNPDKSHPFTDKANRLLQDLDLQTNSIWATYLMAYRLHPEIKKPSVISNRQTLQSKWKEIEVVFRPTSFEGYLTLCIATCLRYHTGGREAWGKYSGECKKKLREWQQSDSFYPCENEAEKYVCAALATECRQVYFITRHW